ncbi:7981_t:CDS:2, partial [Entrophospora sp. SA101]
MKIFFSEDDATLNARYSISIARKIGATIFLLPEYIVEVRPRGKPRDPVWNYFTATEIPHDSHLSAQNHHSYFGSDRTDAPKISRANQGM